MTQSKIERVTIISYHSPPVLGSLGGDIGNQIVGGMSVDIANIARTLDAWGVNVTIFTSNQIPTDKTLEEIVGKNIHLVQIPTGAPTYDKEELKGRRELFAKRVLDYYAQNDRLPDIAYSNYWQSYMAAEALREKWGVPIAVKFHTTETMKEQWIPNWRTDFKRMGEEIKIAQSADGIIISTPACREDLTYRLTDKGIYEVPPGVDSEIFYPRDRSEARTSLGLPLDEHVILSVGRPDPIKNYSALIRALKAIQDDPNRSKLYIIGGDEGDEERKKLAKLSEELGIRDRVKFVDKMGQQQLALWYNAADVVVVPSEYETFGMVALEAMASGIPVIASDVGGLHHLVVDGKTGFLIPLNDRHVPDTDMLTIQLRVLKNNDARRIMGKSALEHSQKYSLEITTRRMLDAYQKVLDAYRNASAKVLVQQCLR